MKSMKVIVALFAVLGLVGIASGAAITNPYSDDFTGYTTNTSWPTQGNWVTPLNGGSPGGVAADGKTWTGGIGAGSAGGGSATGGGTYEGAGIEIAPISTGVVDISVLMQNAYRTNIFLEGDGNQGEGDVPLTASYMWIDFPKSNDQFNWQVRGFWDVDTETYGVTGSGHAPGPVEDNWFELHYYLDFNAHTLLVEWRDVDNTTGLPTGSGAYNLICSTGLPFTSLTWWEYTDQWTSGEVAMVDNFVLTPEPVTMSILAIGAGLSLILRRRRA